MLCGGRMKKREMTNIESLSDDLLIELLVRFPADFLHDIARLVCRRWGRIIHSRAFISAHIQHHLTYGLVLSSYGNPHAIYVTATQGRIKTSELSSRKIIATSCNGLALELDVGILQFTNPLTKQSYVLPSRGRSVSYHQASIAYSAASMEYKVALPYKDHGHPTCLAILTVGVDKSWRHVEIPRLPRRLEYFIPFPLCSEGFLHWGKERYCLTLNVETETMTLTEAPIPPPPPHRYDSFWCYYLSTGRYITLLVRRCEKLSWEVWEMRPAESGEWRKGVVSNIDLEAEKCSLQRLGYDNNKHDLKPVGWVKYPEVLALCSGYLESKCIFLYNLGTHEINKIDEYHGHDHYKAFVHRNSLVWQVNSTVKTED